MRKRIFWIIFVIILGALYVKAENDIFTKRGLGVIQSPTSYDVVYAESYLNQMKNFTELAFEDMINKNIIKQLLKVGNVRDNLRGYIINNNRYAIDLLHCNAGEESCIFRINGVPTGRLNAGKEFTITSTHKLRVDYVNSLYCDEKVYCDLDFDAYSITNISIISSVNCGNSICDTGEDCSSCSQDCGCSSGYKCESAKCVEVVACGDNKCSSGEICLADNCCDGVNVILNSDLNNCGSCGKKCFSNNQTCSSGNCISVTAYCGDKVCDANENCGSCISDCSCATNTRCENNKCVTYCGNNICEPNEANQCKEDCQWCGDDTCNENENYASCPNDCQKSIACGDSVCDSGENSQTCCKDCRCSIGFNCVDNNCISLDKCSSNADCNDNNLCTEDICSGEPKRCSYNNITNCGIVNDSNNKLEPEIKNLSSIEDKTELNQVVANDARIDENNQNEDAGIISTILNWFKKMFGIS